MTQDTCKQMSTKDWLITIVVLIIPVVGFIYLLIWALSERADGCFVSRKNMCLATLMLIPCIIFLGIFPAIALPAYASYMKKAKFTEVINVVESVKTPVALCIQEHGITNVATNCVNGKNGFGWEIKAADAYKTKYVATVVVAAANSTGADTAKDGLITITATASTEFGNPAPTLVLKGDWTAAGQMNWRVDDSSTCDEAMLCKVDQKP